MNIQFASEIAPAVFEARSLDDKCEVLTEGIYHLFAERCSLVSPQARKSGSQHGAHNRILKRLRERKRELKKEFKEAKKRNAPKEVIADLAKQYHVCVRMHSKSTHERRRRDEKKTANTIRSECTMNFWKFSSRLLEEEPDLNNVHLSPNTASRWIQEEELRRALRRARSGSSPSPKDQVPYGVLKRCPAIITPLLHIFNRAGPLGRSPSHGSRPSFD